MSEIENWMASVRAELDDLRRENDELRSQLADLRATPSPTVHAVAGDASTEADPGSEPTARPVSRRGMIAAVAGAAGGVLLTQATPAAAVNGDPVKAGATTTASATTLLATTNGVGFGATCSSSAGTGLQGRVTATGGSTYGVFGSATSPAGFGVYGSNSATTGPSGGYAVFADGRLKSKGRTFLGAPSTAPPDADINNGMITFHLDQAANVLRFRVRYSNGVLKTGMITLV